MGGFLPSAAMSILQVGFDAAQNQQRKDLEMSTQKAQAQAQAKQIRNNLELDRQKNYQAMKRAMASQRARFGAQGLSGAGSTDAVLSGIAAEADRSNLESQILARTRLNEINNNMAFANKKAYSTLRSQHIDPPFLLLKIIYNACH